MLITTVTQKGQVTIPIDFRKKFGLQSGSKVYFEDTGDVMTVRPAPDFFSFRGALKSNKKYDKKAMNEAIGKYLAERHLLVQNGKGN